MQVAVWGAVSAAALGFVVPASADIYRYRDRSGTLVFTNAPATPAARPQGRKDFLTGDNFEGGCRRLRMLLDRHGGNLPLAVAAYNAGTRTVEDAGGVPPIPETREYLARVLRYRLAYLRERAGVLARR